MSSLSEIEKSIQKITGYYYSSLNDDVNHFNSEIRSSNPNLVKLSNTVYKMQIEHSSITEDNISKINIYNSLLKNKKRINQLQYAILNNELNDQNIAVISRKLTGILKISDICKKKYLTHLHDLHS